MKRLNLMLMIFLLTLVASCIENINLSVAEDDNYQVFIFKGKKLHGPYSLLSSSKEYVKLQDWIMRNQTGWSRSQLTPFDSTLAPVEIKGNSFVIKFINETAHVKVNGNVFSKSVLESEYQFLKEMRQ